MVRKDERELALSQEATVAQWKRWLLVLDKEGGNRQQKTSWRDGPQVEAA